MTIQGEQEKPDEGARRVKRLLVVDDDPSLCQFLQIALRDDPVDVECAENGAEALRFYHRAIALDEPKDVLVMDCAMPAQDGFTVVGNIRELERTNPEWPRALVIMHTAHDRYLHDDELIKPLDLFAFIVKPDLPGELLPTVRRALGVEKLENTSEVDSGIL